MSSERKRFWRVVDQDGVSFTTTLGRRRPKRLPGYPVPVQVDRLPRPYETFEQGRWIRDDARAIDAEHLAQHGRDAIARAHAIKAVEASLMLSGIAVDGLILAEARACGIEPLHLAKTISAKTAALIEAEVARRSAKVEAR